MNEDNKDIEVWKQRNEILHKKVERLTEELRAEHKLRQEAEGETNIVKAIGINSPEMKAAKQKIEELQNSIDRLRKENSDLYNRIANLTENQLQKVRESGL